MRMGPWHLEHTETSILKTRLKSFIHDSRRGAASRSCWSSIDLPMGGNSS
jgi:hypothetical protein